MKSKRRVWAVLLGIAAILWGAAATAVTVVFPDPNLEAAIRTSINKPTGPISDTDLAATTFTSLNAASKGITDLTGLNYCTSLTQLGLDVNSITSITPVQFLSKLTDLNLGDNQILVITALANLKNLKNLYLQDNFITDITALGYNSGLGTGDIIDLTNNPVNQDGLCNIIPGLQSRGATVTFTGTCNVVSIPDPQLETILRRAVYQSYIGRLLEILDAAGYYYDYYYYYYYDYKYVTFTYAQILFPEITREEFDWLDRNDDGLLSNDDKVVGDILSTDLERLTELNASNADIHDLTGLEYCTHLISLRLGANRIEDISPLSPLTGLNYLYLGGNALDNLDPLLELINLKWLELQDQHDNYGNRTLDETGIGNLVFLHSLFFLFLHDNNISDLGVLYNNMPLLQGLTLSGNPISTELDVVGTLTSLQSLDLGNCGITNVTPLKNLTKLERLGLWQNQITDITPLSGMVLLKHLDLSGNTNLVNIGTLGNFPLLINLYLDNNEISDLTVLSGLLQLVVLTLSKNQVTDISPLVANSGLGNTGIPVKDRVDLRGNTLSQDALDNDIPALQQRGVIVYFDGGGNEFETMYSLTTAVAVDGSGLIAPFEGTRYYSKDTAEAVTLTATASAGWTFDHWEGDVPSGSDDPTIELIINSNKTVTAVFLEDNLGLILTTEVKGEGSIDPVDGVDHKYAEGTVVDVTATPAEGWFFDHWEDGLSGSVNPDTITMTGGDKHVIAVFMQDTLDYSLVIVVKGNGSTDPPSGIHRYVSDNVVTVTATPASDLDVFDRWEGDLAGNTNPATITMNEDKMITAVFLTPSAIYHLTTAAQPGGTVSPAPGTYAYAEGKQVTLIATSDLGYTLDHWEGDISGAANPLLVTMDANKRVVAVFREFPYISEIDPDKGLSNTVNQVRIIGGRLGTATSVMFGDMTGIINSATDTELVVMTPANPRGMVDVTVTTNLGTARSVGAYTFVDSQGPPTFGEAFPNQGRSEGNENVLIRGQNLDLTSSVMFGDATARIIATEITRLYVMTPAHAPGAVDIVITTLTGTVTGPGAFTYLPRPTLSAVSPNEGTIAGGDTVAISGTNLANATSLTFDGLEAVIVSASETEIVATTPAHAAGAVTVDVTTPGGTAPLWNVFTYFAGAATLTCYVDDASTQTPVLNATVQLDPITRIVEGSADGNYVFRSVRPTAYIVTVSAPDYVTQTKDITLATDEQAILEFHIDMTKPARRWLCEHCGICLKRVNTQIVESTMPLCLEEAPFGAVSPAGSIAIRLTADASIDPESVWAVIEGQDGPATSRKSPEWSATGGVWRPTIPGDDRDGWIVLTPEEPMPPGAALTMTAGAVLVDGTILDPVSKNFQAGPWDGETADPVTLAEETNVVALPEVLAAPKSSVYRIGPSAVFLEPVTIQIPVPAGADPDSLDVYYYSESELHKDWYPAANVIGWIFPDSRQTIRANGQTYIEIQVNHAGVLQLGQTTRLPFGNAAVIELGASGSPLHWASLAATLLALSIILGKLAAHNRNQVARIPTRQEDGPQQES